MSILSKFGQDKVKTYKFKAFEKNGLPYFICEDETVFSIKNTQTAIDKGLVEENEEGIFTVKADTKMKLMPDGVTLFLTGNKQRRAF